MWRLDGKAVLAVDVTTGRPRWSRDTTDLPDSITDLGNGVVVVATRQPSDNESGPPSGTIAMLRADTGDLIRQTVGDQYEPGADGRILLVFTRRVANPDSCAATQNNCEDVTAWDVRTGATVWSLSLPLNAYYSADDRVDALGELDDGGGIRVHDVATGAVTATMTAPPEVLSGDAQIQLFDFGVLTAQRGPSGITVTEYARPSLNRAWSVNVADFTPTDSQGNGYLYIAQCGSDACLTVNGGNSWVIDHATGTVSGPITLQLVQRLGDGVFLAIPPTASSISDSPGGAMEGFIVDPDGRTTATLKANAMVDWSDSADRALVAQEGPQRTEFRVVDDSGGVRSVGSVPGTRLICHARADVLACADPRGVLRVWRLPL
jgi:outer membrane protein assembly factor BamB